MSLLQDVVTTARMLRQTYNIKPNETIDIELRVPNEQQRAILDKYKEMIEGRARLKVSLTSGGDPVPGAAKAVIGADVQLLMPLGGHIDVPAETARIKKEIGKGEKEVAALEKKLGNQDFLSRAPEEIVTEIRQRLADEQQRLRVLVEAVETLGVVK
jgi:valyl-tRNA synthetase